MTVGALAASVIAGGATGLVLTGSGVAGAQTPTPTPTQSAPPAGPRGGGMPHSAAAAAAIGISEDDLRAALQQGQSLAQVAQAHNVDPQKVIDALVADELKELDQRVASGEITQAQADARKTDLTQHITDRVNGVHPAHGPDGPDQPPAGS